MFISERLRAAVFYTGGQAPVGESKLYARVCDGAGRRESQEQPSAGLLTKLIRWTVLYKEDLTEVVLL